MAVSVVSGKGCVFSVWGTPKKEDMDLVLAELREAAEVAGEPVTYVTRVPPNSPAPAPDVQRHLDAMMPSVLQACSTYHVVLEGRGFVAAIKRAVLNSLFMIRWKRGLFFVHAFASEVVHVVPTAKAPAVTALLERAKVVGLLTNDGPTTVPPHATLQIRETKEKQASPPT